jgi:hypothetical protein
MAELTLYVTPSVFEANSKFCLLHSAVIVPAFGQSNKFQLLHQAYLVQFRHKCVTFKYVLERKLLTNAYWTPRNLSLGQLRMHRLQMIRDIVFTIRHNLFLYSNYIPIFAKVSIMFLKKQIRQVQVIPEHLLNRSLDYFVIPSSADDPSLYGLISQLERAQIKSVLAIDNWDNLTSKSVFPFNPDYITVMGEPCKEHAQIIHGLDVQNIWALGLPKFEIFRNRNYINLNVVSQEFTVLYLGFSLQHNEIEVLNSICDMLISEIGIGDFRLIYRPHPYALTRVPSTEELNSIIEVELVDKNDLALNGAPTYDDLYFSSMNIANLVIGPPTTMLLEAMLMGKKCVVDATDDHQHRTTSRVCHEKFLHIQDLHLINELDFVFTLPNFKKFIIKNENEPKNYELSKIMNIENDSYSSQLMKHLIAG